MRKPVVLFLLLLLSAPVVRAQQDIRFDPDYDPRIELRVVVLPAVKDRALRRVSERTISALFATELLRLYEVLDLDRFEQFLADRELTLDQALTLEAEDVVRDSARVDALADIEVYRWDAGTGGIPMLGRKAGRIGVRARIMDPYTGRVYWSVNRLEKVKPGTEFLDRATLLFREMVDDLGVELEAIVEARSEWEGYERQLAETGDTRLESKGQRRYTGAIRPERGFVPTAPKRFGQDALQPVSARPSAQPEGQMMAETAAPEIPADESSAETDPRLMLPPLFADGFEDVEGEQGGQNLEQQRQEYLTPPVLRDRNESRRSAMEPPMPSRFSRSGEALPPLQGVIDSTGDTASPADSTAGNPSR